MSGVGRDPHQTKKSTCQVKRKRKDIGGAHLIIDKPNEESFLIARENNKDNISLIVSPELGFNASPEQGFDDVAGPSILPLLLPPCVSDI